MYNPNASVPKTLIRYLIAYEAGVCPELAGVLRDILDTPVSPELLPPRGGEISQHTEQIVGPYELHDFFIYHALRWGFAPGKVFRLANHAFAGRYTPAEVKGWMKVFYRRFFAQQFKRSCLPDGPKVGSVSLSPRGDWRMPADASADAWLNEVDGLDDGI
jgi:NAD+ synthase (glutamine-hydrolysing)